MQLQVLLERPPNVELPLANWAGVVDVGHLVALLEVPVQVGGEGVGRAAQQANAPARRLRHLGRQVLVIRQIGNDVATRGWNKGGEKKEGARLKGVALNTAFIPPTFWHGATHRPS